MEIEFPSPLKYQLETTRLPIRPESATELAIFFSLVQAKSTGKIHDRITT